MVERVEVSDYTDSAGESSLRVLVVISEDTQVERVPGENIGDLKAEIRRRLRESGVKRYAYIFLAKPSELLETEDEE